MSELHTFIFEGLPVRGVLVQLTDAWVEVLRRRASKTSNNAYPGPVQEMLGQMTAAAVLLQAHTKFNGALVLQVFGDGPVKLAVVEVQADLSLRATATVVGEVPPTSTLQQLVNLNNQGRCAITLDPKSSLPGQQPYQGVVDLQGTVEGQNLSGILEHYMRQSEQLETTLVLAANDQIAAGLLVQRLPLQGSANLGAAQPEQAEELNAHYRRIATLAASLKQEELLTLDTDTILRRLFWEEKIVRFAPPVVEHAPRFACNCSRERVGKMILGLGWQEAHSVLAQSGGIEVGCEFCGLQYRFDPVDTARIFQPLACQPSDGLQ